MLPLRHMSLSDSLRSLIPLVIGLAVGGVGAILFQESLPVGEGSPQENAARLEIELKRAQNRIAALEAANSPEHRPKSILERIGGDEGGARNPQVGKRTLADGARKIAEDIREGKPVSPDDIFRATQPLIRDLAPLFDRMRVKQQQAAIDSMAGEFARKYDLTPQKQEALQEWLTEKAENEAKRWNEMIASDGTRLEDVMRASQDIRLDEGLDSFMPGILSPEKLADFKIARMAERVQRVESQADMRVQQLDAIAGLDDAQRDQVFGIMARSSKEYDPTMVMEGATGEIAPTPAGNREAAMLGVLRPEQRAAYDAERQRRREEAAKDMEAVGLVMPPDWEMFDESGPFR